MSEDFAPCSRLNLRIVQYCKVYWHVQYCTVSILTWMSNQRARDSNFHFIQSRCILTNERVEGGTKKWIFWELFRSMDHPVDEDCFQRRTSMDWIEMATTWKVLVPHTQCMKRSMLVD